MNKTVLIISGTIIFSLLVSIGFYSFSSKPVEARKEQEVYQSIKPNMSLIEVEKRVGKPLEIKKISNQLISETRLYDTYQKSLISGYDFDLYLVVYYNTSKQVVKTYIGH